MIFSLTRKPTLDESETGLAPVGSERLKQIVSRLMLHFFCAEHETQHHLLTAYSDALKDFPEDLLCAAYLHTVRHYRTLPPIGVFIAFMEPEMKHRKMQRLGERAEA